MGDDADDSSAAQLVRDWAAVLPDMDRTAFSIQVLIAQLNILTAQATNRIAARHGINQLDLRLLVAIKRAGAEKPIRPSDLWRRFDIAPSAITRRLNRLCDLGLVTRTPHATDRRGLCMQLTAKGDETALAIVTAFHALTRRRMGELSRTPDGPSTLNQLLAALARDWQGGDDAEG